MNEEHRPVLLAEVLTALRVRPGGAYLDATFGRGGHAGAILEKLDADGRLICIDRDPRAIAAATARFAGDWRVRIFHACFADLGRLADAVSSGLQFDGILFDLGISSPQLDEAERGFSFLHDGPLDMRMNPAEGASAADVVNRAATTELTRIFRELGEEKYALKIARAIAQDRAAQPFLRTRQLASLIERVAPARERHKHPATRVFQALRIFVNRELEQLEAALAAALPRLASGGRIAVISFHSLEDRIVKRFLRGHSKPDPVYAGLPDMPPAARPSLKLIGKSVAPNAEEVAANPRARSARLRIAERLAA